MHGSRRQRLDNEANGRTRTNGGSAFCDRQLRKVLNVAR